MGKPLPRSYWRACCLCSKHIIVHRDLKPANLMLGGIPHDTGTREMAAKVQWAGNTLCTDESDARASGCEG